MTSTIKFLTLTAALAVFSSTAALAAESDRAGRVLTFCAGGAQEIINGSTQNAPASVAGIAAPAVMPFTTVAGGPSGVGADLYVVTFSGEANNTAGGFWTIQAQVSVGGAAFVDIDPVGPNTFHQGNLAETHTMTWCRRISANSTVFRIVWDKIGGAASTAVIDDYTMLVERSD